MTNGEIWSAIRDRLPDLDRQMRLAVDAVSYDAASVYYDEIARQLADAVTLRERTPHGPPTTQSH